MSFSDLTVKTLKQIIATYKKEHTLANYSKLRKAKLIELLEQKYAIKDNKLYLKNVTQETKTKKRITPQLISSSPPKSAISQTHTGLTKGQQTYKDTIDSVTNKEKSKANYLKSKTFAKRIHGYSD